MLPTAQHESAHKRSRNMKCSCLEAARRRTRAAPSKAWSRGTPCEQEQTTKMLAMLSTLSAPQQLSQNVTQQITLLLSSCHLQRRRQHTTHDGGQMHTQKRRTQSLGGIHEANAAPPGTTCTHTVCLTARCTRRSEDRNRLVAYTKHMLPSRNDVHRHRV